MWRAQSFRDSRCPKTLLEIFDKAENPSRVFVGIVQQNTESDVDCFDEYCKEAGSACMRDHVRLVRMHANDARGVMVVRHIASTLYQGEQYFMQIDAHCLFNKGPRGAVFFCFF